MGKWRGAHAMDFPLGRFSWKSAGTHLSISCCGWLRKTSRHRRAIIASTASTLVKSLFPPHFKSHNVQEVNQLRMLWRLISSFHGTGWVENLICNKKYHFLLPSKEFNAKEVSLNYGDDDRHHPTRSMHGVFHSNGYGHLLCINGIALGSELPGFQIMDFWDRLCDGLRARFVIYLGIGCRSFLFFIKITTIYFFFSICTSWFSET